MAMFPLLFLVVLCTSSSPLCWFAQIGDKELSCEFSTEKEGSNTGVHSLIALIPASLGESEAYTPLLLPNFAVFIVHIIYPAASAYRMKFLQQALLNPLGLSPYAELAFLSI